MKFKTVFLTLLIIWSASPLVALEVKDVEGSIMCMCKDKCGKVLANCSCMTSDTYRRQISTMIRAGKTKREIIDNFVERFGERVLAAPTKTGFNLAAWVTPFLALFIAGIVLKRIAQSWVSGKQTPAAADRGAGNEEDVDSAEGDAEHYRRLMEDELGEFE